MPDDTNDRVLWNGRKPKRGEFTQAPLIVTRPGWQHTLKSHRMTLQESALWNILRSYDYGDGLIYVSDQTLAEDTGLSDRQVRTIRSSLKRKGFIDWTHTGEDNRKNTYTIRAPNIKPPVHTTEKISRKKTSAILLPKSRKKTSDQLHKEKRLANTVYQRDITALLAMFSYHYQMVRGHTYEPHSADTRRARALLKAHPQNLITQYFTPFFAMNDNAFVSRDPDFPIFNHLFTQWMADASHPVHLTISNP